ncbi:hypothetical protein [Sphingomonas crusticola]|uniref:hypothetical protein n=1 Tax=Sphingomonas crusticola TaxID=1697973 RepID=UPI000E22FAC3|nr:hypothetical protein [Sphingomonas crusticola]
MAWIAKPGSAEDKFNRWSERVGPTRILLWLSTLFSIVIAWSVFEIVIPKWRILAIIPLFYAAGALATARYFRRVDKPGWLARAVSIFFLMPIILHIAKSVGVTDIVASILQRF